MQRLAWVGVLGALLSGCTWVQVNEGGEGVTVVSSVPTTCRRLGTTTAVTRAEVAKIDRRDSKVAAELQALARNSAATMGGDTILADGPVSEAGEQTFVVYRCAGP